MAQLYFAVLLVVVLLLFVTKSKVRRVVADPTQQAVLNRLMTRMEGLVEYLRIVNDPLTDRLVTSFTKRRPKLVNTNERAGFSYDKGKVIGVCLGDMSSGDNGEEYENELFYVMLHEMAHIGTGKWGHTKEFWHLFELLQHYAIDAELYTDVHFTSTVCGERLVV